MSKRTKSINLFLFIFTVIVSFPLYAQHNTLPFKSGEKLTYKVSYNWEFVWVDAGKAEFEVDSLQYSGKPAYHFKSFGRSFTSYDWVFKVRDNFQSVVFADDFLSVWYERNTREGSYRANNRIDFDYSRECIIAKTENSSQPARVDTIALTDHIFDLQSAVYYARMLDFDLMEVGEKIPFQVIIDGKVYELFGRYLGKEIVENHDGLVYRCHKFSALLVEGTMFQGGEDLFVWLTDDKNHIPILVEAKILIGSAKAYFTGGENILHPMESLVE